MNHRTVAFAGSHPGVEDEGLIFGRGGGFAMTYEAVALLPNGGVRLISYARDYEGEPVDVEAARLFLLETEHYRHFTGELDRIGFRDIQLQASSTLVEYLTHVDPVRGSHTVSWAHGGVDSLPPTLRAAVCAIRGFLSDQFTSVFGCPAATGP